MARRRDTSQFLDWDAARFLYEMRKRKLTWVAIGQQAEPPIKGTGARQALRQRWPRAEATIAKALGVPLEEIWPSRYSRRKDAA